MARHALWLFATMVICAVCLVVPYPLGAKAWANGIPFPYVIWEQLDSGAWGDFTGGVACIAIPIDFAVSALLSMVVWRTLNRWFLTENRPDDAPQAASDQPV